MRYQDEIKKAMTMLAKNPKALFVGQSVRYPGAMFDSLEGVPIEQRIEFPVAEDMQMGFCTGLALQGFLPVCIFPRMDFALLALNQMVNHLDKMQTQPKIIIRTAIGSTSPFNAGPQHSQDHIEAFKLMMPHIVIIDVSDKEYVVSEYKIATSVGKSFMFVERMGIE